MGCKSCGARYRSNPRPVPVKKQKTQGEGTKPSPVPSTQENVTPPQPAGYMITRTKTGT